MWLKFVLILVVLSSSFCDDVEEETETFEVDFTTKTSIDAVISKLN